MIDDATTRVTHMDTPATPEPAVEPIRKDEVAQESPQAFYARITKRPDVQEIMRRLADADNKPDTE